MSDTVLQQLLDRLKGRRDSARAALLEHSFERLRRLARRMFRQQSELQALNDTDEVFQRALIRLHRALGAVHPEDVPGFFGLAARQIRWVLGDMAKELADWQQTNFAHLESSSVIPVQKLLSEVEGEPASLAEWTDFHRLIDALPEEERTMFDLLLYQGLSQAEAAQLLQLSPRTIKRRWQRARLRLQQALAGHWPPLDVG